MARVCTVCTHAERQEIDQRLIDGSLKNAEMLACTIGNANKCSLLTRALTFSWLPGLLKATKTSRFRPMGALRGVQIQPKCDQIDQIGRLKKGSEPRS